MLKYKIHLINVWWDEFGTDTRYFNSIEEQKEYFNSKIGEGLGIPLTNFNIGDNITTTQNIQLDNINNISSMLATNYAVIRQYNEDILVDERYYFASCRQLSGALLEVSLNLDDIQTNYFRVKNYISPCEINRACLNRFVEVDENTVKFDNSPASPLLYNEQVSLPKRLAKRDKLFIPPFKGIAEEDKEFFEKANFQWLYIFSSFNDTVKAFLNESGILDLSLYTFTQLSYYGSDIICIVVPIENINKEGQVANAMAYTDENTSYASFGTWIIDTLLDKIGPYILDAKITSFSPLIEFEKRPVNTEEIDSEKGYYTIDSERYMTLYPKALKSQEGYFGRTSSKGFLLLRNFYNLQKIIDYSIDVKFEFAKDEIKNAMLNPEYNPKIYSSAFYDLNLCDYMGNSFTYDLQRINQNDLQFKLDEVIGVGNSNGYIRLTKNEYYDDKNYCGLVYNNDTRYTYGVDKLTEFLATNKNYSMIQQAQRDYNTQITQIGNNAQAMQMGVKSLASLGVGAMLSVATLNPIPLLGSAVGTLSNATNTLISTETNKRKTEAQNELSKLNEKATLDNMRNSPISIQNAQSDYFLPNIVMRNEETGLNETSFYIEHYKALDCDIKRFNDYCHRFGFEFGQTGELKDFDNIRKRFNYISAKVDTINYNISGTEKERLRAKLNGVRFWNTDDINYDYENYERWLEQ